MRSNFKTDNRRLLSCAAAVLLACSVVASTAFAGDQNRSETVKFADLKVDTQAGAEALYRRISAAAQRVCGYEATSPFGPSTWRNCVSPTVDTAVAKVNNPLLTRLHTGRNPTPATAMINK